MPTCYKPTVTRGKRVVFLSFDPDEPKRETLKFVRFLVGGIIYIAILCLAFCWAK